jgi:hypothetical protein
MTDLTLTLADKQELSDAIDKALVTDSLGDIKQAFCGCWPAVKQVLQWAAKLPVSQKIKGVIAGLVELGDLFHGKLCPAKPGA